ncbi:hypothetical protein CGCVW01_v001138 [Colletotrichum viniferum]|nr:hypothetical protein CGCVW01_v001138 [Colletotrichum viniferum]
MCKQAPSSAHAFTRLRCFVFFGAFLSYLVPLHELPCVIEDCPERVSGPKGERTETTARSLAPEWPHGKVCSRLSPWARAAGWLGVQMPSHKLAYPIFGLVHFSSAHRRSPPLRPTDAEADADTDGQVGFSAHASLSTVRIPANRTIKRYVLATGTNTLA